MAPLAITTRPALAGMPRMNLRLIPNPTHKYMPLRVTKEFPTKGIFECDVSNEESIRSTFDEIHNKYGKIDFIVHAIAYSDKEKKDLPLPASIPIINANTKYTDIEASAMCHFSNFTPYP